MSTLQTMLALVGLIYVLCVVVQALEELLKSLLETKANTMRQTIDKFMGDLLPREKVEEALKVRGLDITALEHFNKDDFRKLLDGIELVEPKVTELIKSGTATLDTAKENIASAYDAARSQFQALYTKKNKIFAIAFSVIVVCVLNANVIMLYRALVADQVMAQAIAGKADKVAAACQEASSQSNDFVDIYNTNRKCIQNKLNEYPILLRSGLYSADWQASWPSTIIGLIFMAVLVSLGAPFWNDILKGLTGLNNTLNTAKKEK